MIIRGVAPGGVAWRSTAKFRPTPLKRWDQDTSHPQVRENASAGHDDGKDDSCNQDDHGLCSALRN